MSRMRSVASVFGLLFISATLSNCSSQQELKKRFEGRWGPNPAIQATDANDNIKRQMLVLQYIANEARIGVPVTANGERHFEPSSAENWLSVTKAGFNLGREDCEIYMDNLFRMARERQRNDSLLNAASLASNAIMQATAVTKAISIVGASFNMATGVNDAIYDSYLFAQAPAIIGEKVKDVQATYRMSIETNSTVIQSPEDAYNAIQNYYSYCLPQSIEGLLLQKIADSNPVGTSKTPTPTTKKKVTTTTTNKAAVLNQRVKLQ